MPTPEEITVIQAQLASAQTAYHNLVTGKAAKVIVDQNGERVEFVQASAARLWAYICSLQKQLTGGRTMGPMMVYF